MSDKIQAYAALAAKGKLELFTYDAPELKPHEVRVKVKFCGVCHSDVAMIDNDFQFSAYPLVAGHEILGHVVQLGSEAHGLEIGQSVGVGWQSGSCGDCEYCRRGKEHLCSEEKDTIVHRHGGFGETLVVDCHLAVPVPAAIFQPESAPLLCAGNTVFGPMLHHGVAANMKVAVVGIGGLGHIAVQFLSKWGCEVTAISSSHAKDEEAKSFGAHHFIATKGTDELKGATERFDFVISTVSADLNWGDYINTVRPEGTFVIVGIPESDMKLPAIGLINREKRIAGGRASSPGDIATMLAFAARTGVKAMIETYPFAEINTAVDRARQGKVRYRAVLER